MRKLLHKVVAIGSAVAAYTLLATPAFAQSYNYDYSIPTTATAAAADSVFGLSFTVVWLCVCCIALVVPLALAVWVYKDAEKHKVENPILWAILVFFFNLIGLLVYLLAIRPEAMKKNGEAPSDKK